MLTEKYLSQLESVVLPVFKELYGTDKDELERQRLRYQHLLSRFADLYGPGEVELFSTPGRTEIGGNHTDHNHGRVLAGAVNLDNIAAASINHSNVIRIESAGYPGFEIDISSLGIIEGEKYTSASIARGICARMKELGFAIGGFDAVIDGEVPKGSGLSSSASFEVLIGTILNHFFNSGSIDPLQIAKIGQFAENVYFGKPCGLMDQTACACGGLVAIDFEDPAKPLLDRIAFDFKSAGFSLVITDTGGNHADLNDEYASLPKEMRSVAGEFGKEVLRQLDWSEVMAGITSLRDKTGDRALLRAFHFFHENQRVMQQLESLKKGDVQAFLGLVNESGRSSFMYNQNIFPVTNIREQGVSLGLAISEHILKGRGAWRVHGGGFAGTIQAFVPDDLMNDYIHALENIFGEGACHRLFIRPQGAVRISL